MKPVPPAKWNDVQNSYLPELSDKEMTTNRHYSSLINYNNQRLN